MNKKLFQLKTVAFLEYTQSVQSCSAQLQPPAQKLSIMQEQEGLVLQLVIAVILQKFIE